MDRARAGPVPGPSPHAGYLVATNKPVRTEGLLRAARDVQPGNLVLTCFMRDLRYNA